MRVLCVGVLAFCALVAADLPAQQVASNRVSNRLGPYSQELSFNRDLDKLGLDDEPLQIVSQVLGRSVIIDIIVNALEQFRDIVINGNGVFPILDPLQVARIGPYDFETSSGTQGDVSINNIVASGLRWFVVDSVTFNPIRLAVGLHLTLPWLTVTGTYDAKAKLVPLLTHQASGNIRVFLHRLELGVDARMGTNLADGHLILRDLDIKLDIHDITIQIDGMTGSSTINSFISSYIQTLTQEVVQGQMATFADWLSETLFDIVNDFLKNYTVGDIMGKSENH